MSSGLLSCLISKLAKTVETLFLLNRKILIFLYSLVKIGSKLFLKNPVDSKIRLIILLCIMLLYPTQGGYLIPYVQVLYLLL